MNKIYFILVIFIVGMASLGASRCDKETVKKTSCEPGSSRSCSCEGGLFGSEHCSTDGTAWSLCTCIGESSGTLPGE